MSFDTASSLRSLALAFAALLPAQTPAPTPGPTPAPQIVPAATGSAPATVTATTTAATLIQQPQGQQPQGQQPQGQQPQGQPPQEPQAQQPQPQAQNPGAAAPPAQDPAAAAAAEAAKKKAEEEQKKQQRLQKIQQVKFDRRAPTMLRTWATPAGEEPTAGGDPNAPAQPTPATPPAAPAPDGKPAAEPQPVLGPDGKPVLGPDGKPLMKPAVDPFDQSLKDWSRAVTLGDWAVVKKFLAGLATDDEKKAAWNTMLNGLRSPPQQNQPQQGNQQQVANRFTFEDVLGIAGAAPLKLDDAAFAGLGALLQLAVARGNLSEALVARLVQEVQKPDAVLGKRDAVKLLFAANLGVEAGEFLPKLEEATGGNDQEGLNLLARFFVAKNKKEGKGLYLEQAWQSLQAIFAAGAIDKKQKDEALRTAVMLAPRIKKELGKAWLDASFTRDVQRGMDILASIGVAAAESAQQSGNDPEFRRLTLELQNTAVGALLAAAPDRAREWSAQLGILADNWLREAQVTYQFDQSASYFPRGQRDRYGNFYYWDDEQWRRQQMPVQPIKTADLLPLRPDETWLQRVEPGLQPKFAMVIAQLWLKVQEEALAFPFIAELAKTHPPQAKELVNEFLRVWTRNHDPNSERRNYYFYGYEQRADGIPLTRSMQQRNLAELAKWVAELRKMPIGDLDEAVLAQAFTTCHSSAEVYRLDAIETVFGSLQKLKPRTISALVQQMRGNLATVWRQPATQERAKTKRREKDIEQEVLRGYQVAVAVVDEALQQHAGDWSLLLGRATLRHDENDFRRELANDPAYAQRRADAFADFADAAAAYQKKVPELLREEETTDVYDHWFYAALGSSELANVTHEQVVDQRQIDAVKQALLALPGDAGERHLANFANGLFSRMSALRPPVKFRYLKAGLAIVGDHKQAFEARKLFDYYKDLVTEIRLETRVDGSTTVPGGEPFGLFVDLRHTREIERESGGFGRYLRNQNDVNYSYNYGRPTEDYRDKFQQMCKDSLGEHFEVLSVTFQTENVHSRATDEYGWRITPYAYVMLKARGPQIDRIPALRLDLDFLDTSGYVVLPVESPALAIETKTDAPPRPAADLEITQILDERQARDGKLMLEVKATGHGMMPPLAQILDLQPAGFVVDKTEDTGPQMSRFDPNEQAAIVGERTWNLTLRAKDGLPEVPHSFAFGKPRIAGSKLVHQRYADADLVAATPEVELQAGYGTPSRTGLWLALAGGLLVIALGSVLFVFRRRAPVETGGLRLPDQLTPFTVLGLLREIRARDGIDARSAAELDGAIAQVEAGYFSAAAAASQDLRALASDWVARAGRPSAAG